LIHFDITIIGAGAVGLATTYFLSKKNLKILLLDKESNYGSVTSSRNTEFIHAGIYYPKNSLKSLLCKKGNKMIYNFCDKNNILYKKIGKLFIINHFDEEKNLYKIFNQGLLNGVKDLKFLTKKDLKDVEPNLNFELALLSPSSGIFDTHHFYDILYNYSMENNVVFLRNTTLSKVSFENNNWKILIKEPNENTNITSDIVINAAGLESIMLFNSFFPDIETPKLNPVKGCYLKYLGQSPFSHAIYPSFNPGKINERFDATPIISGGLKFGPSVEKTESINDYNMPENLINKFYLDIKKYFPLIDKSKLIYDQAGIRPKIIFNNLKNNDFIFDWKFNNTWLNLWGMESPALTSCLSIGEYVTKEINYRSKFAK